MAITETQISKSLAEAKASGEDAWRSEDQKMRGIGVLRLRATPAGAGIFYFRYTNREGKQKHLPIGAYDSKGIAGLTLKQAREEAGELSKLYQAGERDLHAYRAHASAEDQDRRARVARDREDAVRQAKAGSLEKLLDAYAAHLKRQNKESERDVRSLFRLHVVDAFPDHAAMRAAEITNRQISAILARLIDQEKGRTAGKLRSYLRAAFAAALAAEGDPTTHPDLHGFSLESNPAALVPANKLSQFNKARERNLSESEMHSFLVNLAERAGVVADALMLLLLLGGQRPAQFLRLKPANVDLDAAVVTLFDGKGARSQPRVHRIPVTKRAAEIFSRLIETNGNRPFLITLNGKVSARPETLSEMVTDICAAMLKNKTAREPFQLRDVRRTCETMMARLGISKDVRAQILSHGLGGVQGKHYDFHDYMDEKRNALVAWGAKIAEIENGVKTGNVVRMPAKVTA